MNCKLGLHLSDAFDTVVLRDVVLGSRHSLALVKAILAYSGRRSLAISANVDGLADVVLQIKSDVLFARRIDKTIVVSKLVGLCRISAVARATGEAVHEYLRAQV